MDIGPSTTRSAYELAITLGVDAIEPDIVVTRDGVLVLRHENEISGTTDVATRSEFADRRATKKVDGVSLTGWFTEDFSWDELRTLRAVERLPDVRQASATFDNTEGILRLQDLLDILDAGAERTGRPISIVAEVKHPTYFASIGLPLDGLIADALTPWDDGARTIVECFEQTVLGQIRDRGVNGTFVYLLETRGSAPDQVARFGPKALPYSAQLTDAGLARLAKDLDGVSVDKALLLKQGGRDLVDRAHAAGLEVFTWTLRPENRFLAKAHRAGTDPQHWGDWSGEFRAVLETGVDGIFVDHPDLGIAARAEVAGRS